MNCIDKLLLGVTKKVCPQGILRGFTGNIILRDWRGFNQDNPKEAYKTEVKLECDKYSVKPLSDAFVRDDNVSLFDHLLTANLKNISNEALQVLTGIQQIPVIVLVELTDLSYIELFPRNGGKLSFKNDFATQSKDKCQLSIKPFWKDQHEDYPPFNYVTELSVISMSPIDNSIDVAISTAFSLEFNSLIKSSEIIHTIILREAFSKMVIQNFIVSPTSTDVEIDGAIATFKPTSNLSEGVECEIIVPQGTFENIFRQQNRYIGSGEWSFTTAQEIKYLNISQDFPSISSVGGQITFTISSNTSWTIIENSDWISLNRSSGTGNGTVIASIATNTSLESRQANVTFSGAGVIDVIKNIVQQEQGTWQTPLMEPHIFSSIHWSYSLSLGVWTVTPKVDYQGTNPLLTAPVPTFRSIKLKFKYKVSGGTFAKLRLWAGEASVRYFAGAYSSEVVDTWVDVELTIFTSIDADIIDLRLNNALEELSLSHVFEFKEFSFLI